MPAKPKSRPRAAQRRTEKQSPPKSTCYLHHEIDGNDQDFDPKKHHICPLCQSKLANLGRPGFDFDWRGTMVAIQAKPLTDKQTELLEEHGSDFEQCILDFFVWGSRSLSMEDAVTLLEYQADNLRWRLRESKDHPAFKLGKKRPDGVAAPPTSRTLPV